MQNFYKSFLLVVSIVVLMFVGTIGCGSGTSVNSSTIPQKMVILAVDTSGSAAQKKEILCKRASQDFYATADSDDVVIFRFDSDPAEIYSGETPSSEEEAAMKLKSLLPYTQQSKGTNLLKLVQKIDELEVKSTIPMEIFIYTDCGFEEMTNTELDKCKEVTGDWAKIGKAVRVNFVGVSDGFREKLRKLVAIPRDQVRFLE